MLRAAVLVYVTLVAGRRARICDTYIVTHTVPSCVIMIIIPLHGRVIN
jgi:hypothetical protein